MSANTETQTQAANESTSQDVAAASSSESKAPIESVKFASPTDLLDADVVIYDGKCVFCRKSIGMLDAWVSKDQLCYVSLHDSWVAENVPDLTYDDMMKQMYLIARSDGSKHAGAEAIRYLSTRSWKLWIAAPFLHFPFSMPLWQWMYQQVAKRRYLIAGKDDDACDEDGTCKVHFDQ